MTVTGQQAPADQGKRRRTRIVVLLSVLAGLGIFLGANAHLLHVAFTSQPECVPHERAADDGNGSYRAAKSAC
ncbi:hypothetical protein [Fodinicurvata fenggangensis]|uniref:hypothetical protein n=1 Tax=Fodinicurvata fenggangensis TaxID=1121830 RepID=UPI000557142A|nr:hypothetical protein [Fodinicurvata fenggangensis]